MTGVFLYRSLPGKRIDRHLARARAYALENNFNAAMIEYQTAYNGVGGFTPYVSLEVLAFMNRNNFLKGNFSTALRNAGLYVKMHPGDKEGELLLAEAAWRAEDWETAIRGVEVVLRLDPKHFQARILRARLALRQQRPDSAAAQMRFLYREYPDSLPGLFPLAEEMLKAGLTDASLQFGLEAIRKNPKNENARVLLVDAYMEKGDGDSALLLLNGWRADDYATALFKAAHMARILSLAGRHGLAEQALQPYRDISEENLPALSEWALIKAREGRYDSAIAIYSATAANIPPRLPGITRLNAYLHLKNGDPAGALEAVKTLQVENRDPGLLPLELACYLAMDRDHKAEALWQTQPDSLKSGLRQWLARWTSDKAAIGPWAWTEYLRQTQAEYMEISANYLAR